MHRKPMCTCTVNPSALTPNTDQVFDDFHNLGLGPLNALLGPFQLDLVRTSARAGKADNHLSILLRDLVDQLWYGVVHMWGGACVGWYMCGVVHEWGGKCATCECVCACVVYACVCVCT